MDLLIKQNTNQQENGNSALIDLLYDLTKPDPITGQAVVNNATLVGRISVPAAYEDAVNFLNTRFSVEQDNGSDFHITADYYYIRFADEEVVRVLLANNIGDGTGVTVQNAVTANIGTVFINNVDIESFNEFTYFIRANNSPINQMFYGCTSLTRLNISELCVFPKQIFMYCRQLSYFNGTGSEQGTAIIAEGTTTMSYKAFNECNGLIKIYLPDTLASLEDNVFDNCTGLQEVHFGNNIRSVGNSAF